MQDSGMTVDSIEVPHLKRTLGRWNMTLLTIGCVIGSGIFLVPGQVAVATGMSTLAAAAVWLVGAALSICGAITYAELARLRPEAGGLYIYIRDGHGPGTAFVFGWMSLFVNVAGTIAALAAATAPLLKPLLPAGVPDTLVAVILTFGLGCLNLLPTRQSGDIQDWTAIAKFAAVLLCAALLISRARLGFHSGSLGEAGATPGHANLIVALVAVLWAFEGWQYVSCAAGEAKDATHSVAFGLIVGVSALALVYLVTSVAITLWLSPAELASSTNVVEDALRKANLIIPALLVTLILPIAILSTAHATLLTGSRVVYAMAKDELLPAAFGQVSRRTNIPTWAVFACTVAAMTLAALGTFDSLLAYVIVTSWLFYGLAGLAIFRIRAPNYHRSVLTNCAAIAFCVGAAGVMLFGLISGPSSARYGLGIAALGWVAGVAWFRVKRGAEAT
jgi:basic amino acid/polyamine antiporter, APA family